MSFRWSMAGLASCGMQQCWSTSLIMTRIAPSTPSATTPQTVDTVSPCSTAAPTGTFSLRGTSLNSKQQPAALLTAFYLLCFVCFLSTYFTCWGSFFHTIHLTLSSLLGLEISPALEKSCIYIYIYISYLWSGSVSCFFYCCSRLISVKNGFYHKICPCTVLEEPPL